MKPRYWNHLLCSAAVVFFSAHFNNNLFGQETGASKAPDLILHHAKVLTVNKDFAIAEAVAISGNRIVAVGQNADILKLAGPGTKSLDLKGRTVVPGLIDTHRHIDRQAEAAYGGAVWASSGKFEVSSARNLQRFPIDWRGVRTKDDVLNQIKGWMDKIHFQPGEWVYFVQEVNLAGAVSELQARIVLDELNRWELDKAAPDNPIILSMGIPENNGLIVNSKAVDIIFKQSGDFLKRAGHYWIDAQGRPDGHLESPATRIAQNHMYNRDPQILAPIFKTHLEELAAMGVTMTGSNMPHDSVDAYKILESRGEMTVRLGYGKGDDFGNISDLKKGLKPLKSLVGSGSDLVWVNSITPGSMDGASNRACTGVQRVTPMNVTDNYWPTGQCYMDIEYRGAKGKGAPIAEDYYKDWVLLSGLYGVRFGNTHVAGDRSVALMLNFVQQIQKQAGPSATAGWSFDHCTYVDPNDFKRAAKLGVMFSCASKYIESTAASAARTFGDKVANTYVTPVKSMINWGIEVVLETDRDVYIWHDLWLFLTRKDSKGKVWGPQEIVDRPTVLRMATRSAADYMLKGDKTGSIEPGKLADLLVLDRDFLTVPVDDVPNVRPELTMVGGKIVFVHPAFAEQYQLKPPGAYITTYEEMKKVRTYDGPQMEF